MNIPFNRRNFSLGSGLKEKERERKGGKNVLEKNDVILAPETILTLKQYFIFSIHSHVKCKKLSPLETCKVKMTCHVLSSM